MTGTQKFTEAWTERCLRWTEQMLLCVERLSPEERADFDLFDRTRTGDLATSDWPGFRKYLPQPPWKERQ